MLFYESAHLCCITSHVHVSDDISNLGFSSSLFFWQRKETYPETERTEITWNKVLHQMDNTFCLKLFLVVFQKIISFIVNIYISSSDVCQFSQQFKHRSISVPERRGLHSETEIPQVQRRCVSSEGHRCCLLSWWSTPVSLCVAACLTSCVLLNHCTQAFSSRQVAGCQGGLCSPSK